MPRRRCHGEVAAVVVVDKVLASNRVPEDELEALLTDAGAAWWARGFHVRL